MSQECFNFHPLHTLNTLKKYKTLAGKSFPIGATFSKDGVNFCIYSRSGWAVELLLFDENDHTHPTHVFNLDPRKNKTYHYWHIFIKDITPGQLYAYRVDGPFDPSMGLRFNKNKVLIDPYSRAVVTDTYDRDAAKHHDDNCPQAIKSVVIDPEDYDWEEDDPIARPFAKSIIYELHVGGFTNHPSSGLPKEKRGTYTGLVEKIPYLKRLGITAIELMPVQQFDAQDVVNPDLDNYWGYTSMAFFAPHNGYSYRSNPIDQVNEFKDMVKALHKEGIEVILDVVFNHTSEGDQTGPTLSFKGLENEDYYILEKDMHFYKNYSGTGNTMKANNSIVKRLILDCLKRWVSEFHIDGFRFDLAAVFSRDEEGHPIKNPPILWDIETNPVLASTKIIAEAWDVDQYLLGSFIGDKWAEWNGRYRDDVRRFVKGDNGIVNSFANSLAGSSDLFKTILRDPNRSINFITCHDGFTLNDLVSYNEKHNWANGEDNRDGTNDNFGWNCGVEGKTQDEEVEKLRIKQIKNFFTLLMISQGTPMILMGDEVRRTQNGNNNAYCHNNELSWFNWEDVEDHADMLGFVKKLIGFNLNNLFFQEDKYWAAPHALKTTYFSFHGIEIGKTDWGYHSHALAFNLKNPKYTEQLHVMINAFWEPLSFQLPNKGITRWKKVLDTSKPSPYDFVNKDQGEKVKDFECLVDSRSIVIASGELFM